MVGTCSPEASLGLRSIRPGSEPSLWATGGGRSACAITTPQARRVRCVPPTSPPRCRPVARGRRDNLLPPLARAVGSQCPSKGVGRVFGSRASWIRRATCNSCSTRALSSISCSRRRCISLASPLSIHSRRSRPERVMTMAVKTLRPRGRCPPNAPGRWCRLPKGVEPCASANWYR